MCFSAIRLAVHDPDPAAIRFPPGDTGAEVLVGVSYALVIFLFKFVLVGVRIRVTAAPEFLDEAFALVVVSQFFESLSLFVGDDVSNVFIEPVFVGFLQFRFYIAGFGGWILLILCEHDRAGTEKKTNNKSQTESDFLVRH